MGPLIMLFKSHLTYVFIFTFVFTIASTLPSAVHADGHVATEQAKLSKELFEDEVLSAEESSSETEEEKDVVFMEDMTDEEIISEDTDPYKDTPSLSSAIYRDPLDECRNTNNGERYILGCLNDHLVLAQQAYMEMNSSSQMQINTISNRQNRRRAMKALTNSNMAFEAYREAECNRQKSAADNAMEAHFNYLNCKIDLLKRRTSTLQLPHK